MFCHCCNLPRSKICSNCGIEKAVSEFQAGRRQCKVCRKAYGGRYLSKKAVAAAAAEGAAQAEAEAEAQAVQPAIEVK